MHLKLTKMFPSAILDVLPTLYNPIPLHSAKNSTNNYIQAQITILESTWDPLLRVYLPIEDMLLCHIVL